MLLERLAFQTKKTPDQLIAFSRTASRLYKVFDIEKRGGGFRTIEQPSKSLKAIQRWLEKFLLRHYPVHEASMGYRKGLSIKDNAEAHMRYQYTLRMDFRNFFWSFTKKDIISFFNDNKISGFDLSDNDINFIAGVVTREDRLVMGAPSSPTLTNIMMFRFDRLFDQISIEFDSKYTRYADDIFFSSNDKGVSKEISNRIRHEIELSHSPKLELNNDKTCFLSRKSHRSVTGLIITPKGQLSIGRDRKRMIKSILHQAVVGNLPGERLAELAGFLNWCKAVEPKFINSLKMKYGLETVDRFSLNRAVYKFIN